VDRTTERLVRALIAVTLVDSVVAGSLRFPDLARLLGGRSDVETVIGGVGAAWLVVLLVLLFRVLRRVRTMDGQVAALTMFGNDWYWESDEHLTLTFSSPNVQRLLGYHPEDVIGRSLLELVPLEDADRLRDALARAHATRTGWESGRLRWRHKDGSLVVLEGSALPMLGPTHEILGFRGTRRPPTRKAAGTTYITIVRDRVERAVQSSELDIALQPVVDLATSTVIGAEALARFRDGRGPDAWFADAAVAGCTVELELAMLQLALGVLPQLPPETYLTVNASPLLVADPRFEALLTQGHDLGRLVLEITEHAAIASYQSVLDVLAPHRAAGLRLAVDDVGAGYASFVHVLELRPEIIKVDRSVITRVPHDAAARALVTAIGRLAAEMDAHVVAEGVETPLELRTLEVLGVRSVQGYLLARPTTDPQEWRAWHRRGWIEHRTTPARPG
jgi:PAS domain S-box-containing protein